MEVKRVTDLVGFLISGDQFLDMGTKFHVRNE